MARTKKEKKVTEETETPIPEAPVSNGQPNQWDRKVKVTLEELLQIQTDGKLVGYYEEKGERIALIRD